jgi:isopentenyl diphosphate isomerase/L-lactate dehydrogenase-like FMN-dependent dehydrogenase
VDAVGDRYTVILDSGIRRGTHIVKALALGAKMVLVGRATLCR